MWVFTKGIDSPPVLLSRDSNVFINRRIGFIGIKQMSKACLVSLCPSSKTGIKVGYGIYTRG